MAIAKKREKVQSPNSSVPDTHGYLRSFVRPSGLSLKDRVALFFQGRKDAKNGLVYTNEYDELVSPYCESLIQFANGRIELEWENCNSKSFEAIENLKQTKIKIDAIDDKLEEIVLRKDELLSSVRDHLKPGDENVSEHLVSRRQQNREAPIFEWFNNESNSLKSERDAIEIKAVPYRHAVLKFTEYARSREQIIRADYLWRLSAYAYGASNYVKIVPEMINDSALTKEPEKNHEKIFSNTEITNSSEEE